MSDDATDPNPPREVRDLFGKKPTIVTSTQWAALNKLHITLAHPATTSLQPMRRRARARPGVVASLQFIGCTVCSELARPTDERNTALHDETKASNNDLHMDDLELVLCVTAPGICAKP